MTDSFAYLKGLIAIILLLGMFPLVQGCEEIYPEIVVQNTIDDHILIRNISFNGCIWDEMLAFEDSTRPGRCLPGSDRIHFQKFDPKKYCEEQVDDGVIDGLCFCDEEDEPDADPMDTGLINEEPMWFNYQTKTTYDVGHGSFHLFDLSADDLEQDFSVPGPYGH